MLPVLAALFSMPAQAAFIQGGQLDKARGVIQLTLSYGGCSKQSFRLEHSDVMGYSNPPRLVAKLVSEPSGPCRMAFLEVVEFPLSESGLNLEQLAGASLTILGDNDSKVTVRLPGGSAASLTDLERFELKIKDLAASSGMISHSDDVVVILEGLERSCDASCLEAARKICGEYTTNPQKSACVNTDSKAVIFSELSRLHAIYQKYQ